MDAHSHLDPHFTVTLRGAPEIFSPRRAELEETVRRHLHARYGGEAAAADALHAYLDSLALEPGEIDWHDALRAVVDELKPQLPPGAHFACALEAGASAHRGA